MTREEFKAKAKEVIDNEQFGIFGALFEYGSFEEMKVAQIPGSLDSAESDMPLDDFLDKLYERIEQDSILDKIKANIAMYEADCRLSDDEYLACEECTDNVFGSIYRIIDKYKAGEEE